MVRIHTRVVRAVTWAYQVRCYSRVDAPACGVYCGRVPASCSVHPLDVRCISRCNAANTLRLFQARGSLERCMAATTQGLSLA